MSLLNYSFLMKMKDHFIFYPVFSTFNYFWGLGSMAFVCLIVQLVTGFMITMFYYPSIDLAFYSMEYFMSSFSYGWLMSYIHSNGASIFFMLVYMHIGSGIFYKSYNKMFLWMSGFLLWFMLMAVSFLGYVLPWGQMSYWGCMVITSLCTVIPFAGEYILHWIWGGNMISEMTLMSLYSLHFLLPFILLSLSIYHMLLLHVEGSYTPMGMENFDYLSFYPYFLMKDMFGLVFMLLFLYFYLVIFNPNKLGETLNYLQANDIKTPAHMVPEWYFLPFYCMLSCMPHKALGMFCMFFSMVMMALLAFYPNSLIPTKFDLIHKYLFTLFIVTCINLEWLATQLMTDYIMFYSSVWTIIYFLYFILLYMNYMMENCLITYLYKKKK